MVYKRVFKNERAQVFWGDCREVLAEAKENSFDAIVTDPPYELGFMGKSWDSQGIAFDPKTWAACYRVLKPGAHMFVFGGTRTFHRIACAIEDAGFEIRDSIAWMYGSGFPKSQDISKAIDKQAGAEREVVGTRTNVAKNNGQNAGFSAFRSGTTGQIDVTIPATPAAQEWDGWGTALKPAFEPIILARKPIEERTIAQNVLAYGTGGLNIDATRISFQSEADKDSTPDAGRWPANVILDESQAAALDEQSGVLNGGRFPATLSGNSMFGFHGHTQEARQMGDSGGASRFFYTTKANKKERPVYIKADGTKIMHATVKPLAIMTYLVRLITPPQWQGFRSFCGLWHNDRGCHA